MARLPAFISKLLQRSMLCGHLGNGMSMIMRQTVCSRDLTGNHIHYRFREKNLIILYPNPFDPYIHITLQGKARLKLFDISGILGLTM